MSKSDLAGLGVLAASAALAAGLGLHGLRHPGPILAAGAGGLGVSSTPTAKSPGASHTASGKSGNPGSNGTGGHGSPTTAPTSTLRPTSTRLSQTAYAPYAVALYPTRAQTASQALSGFTLKIANDGPLSKRLEVFVAGATTAALSEVIARTDKVYFVEGSMGDDAASIDTNGGDDGLIVTNAAGYVLQ